MEQYLARRADRHVAKVISFYIAAQLWIFKNWILFEWYFVFLVSFVGYMKLKEHCRVAITFISRITTWWISRGRLFSKGGRDDLAKPTTITMLSTQNMKSCHWIHRRFLYVSPYMFSFDGILLDHLFLCISRFGTKSTSTSEDVKEPWEPKPSKVDAWNKRKKLRLDKKANKRMSVRCQS